MYLINRIDLPKFRLTIAKYLFLSIYINYELIEDSSGTNYVFVRDSNKQEWIAVSLFGMPNTRFKDYEKILVYKQKAFKNCIKLSNQFTDEFNNLLMKALFSPSVLLERNNNFLLFSKLFNGILLNEERVSHVKGNVFKYYSEDIYKKGDVYNNRLLGNITFVHPDEVNEPFDCKCIYPKPF